jgi:hypothetical protein
MSQLILNGTHPPLEIIKYSTMLAPHVIDEPVDVLDGGIGYGRWI